MGAANLTPLTDTEEHLPDKKDKPWVSEECIQLLFPDGTINFLGGTITTDGSNYGITYPYTEVTRESVGKTAIASSLLLAIRHFGKRLARKLCLNPITHYKLLSIQDG